MPTEEQQKSALLAIINSVTLASKRGNFSLVEENSFSDRALLAIRAFKGDLELPAHLQQKPIPNGQAALKELGELVTIAHEKGLFELYEQSVLGAAFRVFNEPAAQQAPVAPRSGRTPPPVPPATDEDAAAVDAILEEADESPKVEEIVDNSGASNAEKQI
jgi:hypothetical protein